MPTKKMYLTREMAASLDISPERARYLLKTRGIAPAKMVGTRWPLFDADAFAKLREEVELLRDYRARCQAVRAAQ